MRTRWGILDSGGWGWLVDCLEGVVEFEEPLGCPPQVVFGIDAEPLVVPPPIAVMIGVDHPAEMPPGSL